VPYSFLADIGQADATGSQIGQQRLRGPPQHSPLGVSQRARTLTEPFGALPARETFLAQNLPQMLPPRRVIRAAVDKAAPVECRPDPSSDERADPETAPSSRNAA
jgi:hypothetical protein